MTNTILAVKITKLEPHSGYYLKPGEKLITGKPITKWKPRILWKMSQNEGIKNSLSHYCGGKKFWELYFLQAALFKIKTIKQQSNKSTHKTEYELGEI